MLYPLSYRRPFVATLLRVNQFTPSVSEVAVYFKNSSNGTLPSPRTLTILSFSLAEYKFERFAELAQNSSLEKKRGAAFANSLFWEHMTSRHEMSAILVELRSPRLNDLRLHGFRNEQLVAGLLITRTRSWIENLSVPAQLDDRSSALAPVPREDLAKPRQHSLASLASRTIRGAEDGHNPTLSVSFAHVTHWNTSYLSFVGAIPGGMIAKITIKVNRKEANF